MKNIWEFGFSSWGPVSRWPFLAVAFHGLPNPGKRKESFSIKIDSPGKKTFLTGIIVAGHCSHIIQDQLVQGTFFRGELDAIPDFSLVGG